MVLRSGTIFVLCVALEGLMAPVGRIGWVFLFGWGSASSIFSSHINTLIQLRSNPAMKGRTMAIWNIVLWGTTAIGAPIVGYIGQHFGSRASLWFACSATLAFIGYAYLYLTGRWPFWSPNTSTVQAFQSSETRELTASENEAKHQEAAKGEL